MAKILVFAAFVVIALAYAVYWARGGGNLFLGM
jgi:hypothetical protein